MIYAPGFSEKNVWTVYEKLGSLDTGQSLYITTSQEQLIAVLEYLQEGAPSPKGDNIMSSNVLLYSSHLITDEELAEVIFQADGVLSPGSPAGYFGGLVAGEAYVWVSRIPCYDGVFDYEGKPMDEKVLVVLEQAKCCLGRIFKPGFILRSGEPQAANRWLSASLIRAVNAGRASLKTMSGNSFLAKRSNNCTSKEADSAGMDDKKSHEHVIH